MTEQKEIREGAIKSLMNYKGFDRAPTKTIIDCIFNYLHSQDVMIVKFPPINSDLTGCVIAKVKPLIEEAQDLPAVEEAQEKQEGEAIKCD